MKCRVSRSRFCYNSSITILPAALCSLPPPSSSSSLGKDHVLNSLSVDEIIAEFKSLEDVVDERNSNITKNQNYDKDVSLTPSRNELQMHDFRRPKLQEYTRVGNKFRKLNRVYSMDEMRKHGIELKSVRRGSLQQKHSEHVVILSEFIL